MPSSTIKREQARSEIQHAEPFDGVAIWLLSVSVILGLICGNIVAGRRQ